MCLFIPSTPSANQDNAPIICAKHGWKVGMFCHMNRYMHLEKGKEELSFPNLPFVCINLTRPLTISSTSLEAMQGCTTEITDSSFASDIHIPRFFEGAKKREFSLSIHRKCRGGTGTVAGTVSVPDTSTVPTARLKTHTYIPSLRGCGRNSLMYVAVPSLHSS
jgi:hypothetical protein